ncbi:type I polyketide synthase, partial [Micromonospora eburnea]
TSRHGPHAHNATQLITELTNLGADVNLAACDVSDRSALSQLIASISPDRPLTAVVHAAGVVDDGLVEDMTAERIDAVMRPKADAAWHLHQLTAGVELSAFILFSSLAATTGNPGQANYGAANSFLDALAQHRHARGLPATSLAWGPWANRAGMTSGLRDADHTRMRRHGIRMLSEQEGLDLFDAYDDGPAVLVPARFDESALRARADADGLPAILRRLLRHNAPRSIKSVSDAGRTSLTSTWAQRLTGMPQSERQQVLVDLVRSAAAAVLGHGESTEFPAERTFKEAGFDSLTAVELRNQLNISLGLRLSPTLVFDHPTPVALATHLLGELCGDDTVDIQSESPVDVSDDPIAIIGMSCRFPGNVRSAADLWNLVLKGTDTVSGSPIGRGWDLDALYDPDPMTPGRTYTTRGSFYHDADQFDAEFFGISPREALAMDPQQRLLLETAWEALEKAGIDPTETRGTDAGVFTGVAGSEYLSPHRTAPEDLGGYLLTGNAVSVASGRVSFSLGLRGPAVT